MLEEEFELTGGGMRLSNSEWNDPLNDSEVGNNSWNVRTKKKGHERATVEILAVLEIKKKCSNLTKRGNMVGKDFIC